MAYHGREIPINDNGAGVINGLGRTYPGPCEAFVHLPASNVAPLETALPWAELAALPAVYCTVCSCLCTVLDVQRGDALLLRDSASTMSQAALHLALDAGARVTAMTRRPERCGLLKGMGAAAVVLE